MDEEPVPLSIPKSKDYIKEYINFNNPIHSVFLEGREIERRILTKGMRKKTVIVAWGVNSVLRELATAAIKKLPNGIKGLKGGKDYLYYHPLPRGKNKPQDWLQQFITQVDIVKTKL